MFRRHARHREPWGQCRTCGLDYPMSRMAYSARYGWQCTGRSTSQCFQPNPERDDYLRTRRFPLAEGTRRVRMPVVPSDS